MSLGDEASVRRGAARTAGQQPAAQRRFVFFVSDAHLGSGSDSRRREVELCSFLDSIKPICCKLFLLGDMFDFWFTYRHLVPRGHVRLLGKLAELADAGVEVHFFIGNHDMWLFDYLEDECGAVMHSEPEVLAIGGRRFLIGHGDGLGHTDRGFDFIRSVFRNRFNQHLFALLPAALTFPVARRWSDSNKRKHEREDAQHYLGDDREGIVLYCRERLQHEHFDFCVFGHRHTPLVMSLGEGCTYVNTGDWLTHRTCVRYDTENGQIELYEHTSDC